MRSCSALFGATGVNGPIGNILKYKVRLCVSGSQQELDGTIGRPMLLLFPGLCLPHPFTLQHSQPQNSSGRLCPGIPQAPLEDPVFMRMPQGWFVNDDGLL
jgi:hypothetical protein